MQPERYHIYDAKYPWKNCDDPRPWLVIDERKSLGGSVFGCFPFSSECYSGHCFFIDAESPEFSETGLRKSSYIHDESIVELPLAAFKSYRGKLTGGLLDAFKKYAGL